MTGPLAVPLFFEVPNEPKPNRDRIRVGRMASTPRAAIILYSFVVVVVVAEDLFPQTTTHSLEII